MARSSGFSLEEIDAALEAADVSPDTKERVRQALSALRKPSGRPPEDDDALLLQLAELVSSGLNPHAAAGRVTEHMAESLRGAASKRLYKKYMKDRELWQERVDRPRMERLAKWRESVLLGREQRKQIQGELDRLLESLSKTRFSED